MSPSSLKDEDVAESVDRAVADLRYGSIGVNVWHGLSFAMGSTSGGRTRATPAPTSSRAPASSGTRPCSTARRSPSCAARSGSRPKPPWFATAADSYDVMRRFVAFEAEPSAAKIPGLLLAAMRQLRPAAGAASSPTSVFVGAQLRNRVRAPRRRSPR